MVSIPTPARSPDLLVSPIARPTTPVAGPREADKPGGPSRSSSSRACRPPPDPTTPDPRRPRDGAAPGRLLGRRPARSTLPAPAPRTGRAACPRTGTVSPHRVAVSAWFRRRPCPPSSPLSGQGGDRHCDGAHLPSLPQVWLCSARWPRDWVRSGERGPRDRHGGPSPRDKAAQSRSKRRAVALFGAGGPGELASFRAGTPPHSPRRPNPSVQVPFAAVRKSTGDRGKVFVPGYNTRGPPRRGHADFAPATRRHRRAERTRRGGHEWVFPPVSGADPHWWQEPPVAPENPRPRADRT